MTQIEEKIRKIAAIVDGYHDKMLLMSLELATTNGDDLDVTAKQYVIGSVASMAGALQMLSHQLETLYKQLPEIRERKDFDEMLEIANFLVQLNKKKEGGKPN